MQISMLAPPLLGAVIGYLTNYIAIRMLFRPLRPWRIFGFRLPFTPGVIPAKRHELAKNIGNMVGEHLFTGADLSRGLADKSFQQDLQAILSSRLDAFLGRKLGSLPEEVPDRFNPYLITGARILRWRLRKYVRAHLNSPSFEAALGEVSDEALQRLLAKDFDVVVPPESREAGYAFLRTETERFLAGEAVSDWIRRQARARIDTFIATEGSLADILPESLREALLDRFEEEAPRIMHKVASMAQEPEVQERIAKGIATVLTRFVSGLGPLAAMLGSFVQPDTVTEKIKGYLREKGGALSDWLADQELQDRLGPLLRERAAQFMMIPLSALLKDVPESRQRQARDFLADMLAGMVSNPETATAVAGLLRDRLEAETGKPLGQLLADAFGQEKVAEGKEWFRREAIAMVRSPAMIRILDTLFKDLLEGKLLTTPIGRLSDFLPREVQKALHDSAYEQVAGLLSREMPLLLETLDVRRIVTRKVDSLDLLKLEGLLLSIMEEQFKYINLFGAILGFLIGLLNLVFLA